MSVSNTSCSGKHYSLPLDQVVFLILIQYPEIEYSLIQSKQYISKFFCSSISILIILVLEYHTLIDWAFLFSFFAWSRLFLTILSYQVWEWKLNVKFTQIIILQINRLCPWWNNYKLSTIQTNCYCLDMNCWVKPN